MQNNKILLIGQGLDVDPWKTVEFCCLSTLREGSKSDILIKEGTKFAFLLSLPEGLTQFIYILLIS